MSLGTARWSCSPLRTSRCCFRSFRRRRPTSYWTSFPRCFGPCPVKGAVQRHGRARFKRAAHILVTTSSLPKVCRYSQAATLRTPCQGAVEITCADFVQYWIVDPTIASANSRAPHRRLPRPAARLGTPLRHRTSPTTSSKQHAHSPHNARAHLPPVESERVSVPRPRRTICATTR